MRLHVFSSFPPVFSTLLKADQTEIPDYATARDEFFWDDLYRGGGRSLYCGESVGGPGRRFNVEHIYPASWMKEVGSCVGRSRDTCRRSSRRFNLMEADLHNLYPALKSKNQDRSNYAFAVLPGQAEERCDFEDIDRERLVEPAPMSRGNIARAILYMSREYNTTTEPPFPTAVNQRALMESWHCSDPVDKEELRRNDVIERIQGTRNPFIDNPSLIDCSAVSDFPED